MKTLHRFTLTGLLILAASPAPAQTRSTVVRPRTRTYYLAADKVAWDYVPGGRDEIVGAPYADTAFFAKAKPRPVSTVYQKVLYREYTDGSFRTLKP
ncbi:MAG: hypothetical protein ACRELE_02000, partial [Gemmatimonadales bacterium]